MWVPHVTVAVIVEVDGLFLLVEEVDQGKTVLNQPAGHVEEGEEILAAAVRETLEETCLDVELRSCLGISRFIAPNGNTYFRHSFVAELIGERPDVKRDPDILNTHWMSFEQVKANREQLRSPMVLEDFERFASGQRYPLTLYSELSNTSR